VTSFCDVISRHPTPRRPSIEAADVDELRDRSFVRACAADMTNDDRGSFGSGPPCVEWVVALPRTRDITIRYDVRGVIMKVNKSEQAQAPAPHRPHLEIKGPWFVQSMMFAAVFMTVQLLTDNTFAGECHVSLTRPIGYLA